MTKQFWQFLGIIGIVALVISVATKFSFMGILTGLIVGCFVGMLYLIGSGLMLPAKFNQVNDGLERGPHSPE